MKAHSTFGIFKEELKRWNQSNQDSYSVYVGVPEYLVKGSFGRGVRLYKEKSVDTDKQIIKMHKIFDCNDQDNYNKNKKSKKKEEGINQPNKEIKLECPSMLSSVYDCCPHQ